MRRGLRTTVAATTLLAAFTGFVQATATASVSVDARRQADEEDGPAVELLEAGAEPRQAVRLALTPGSTHECTAEQKIEVTVPDQPAQRATTEMVITETVTAIDDRGHAHLDFTYDSISSDNRAARKSLEGFDGATAKVVITPLNQVVSQDLALTDDGTALTRQVIDLLGSQIENLSSPFPDEAVGQGARWKTTSTLDLYGMKTRMTTLTTLVRRSNDELDLRYRISMRAPSQRATFPGAPKKVVTKGKVDGTGRGSATTSVTQSCPRASRMSSTSSMTFEVTDGDHYERVELKLEQDVKQSST